MFVALTVQAFPIPAVTLKVVVVVEAKAEVEIKPSARNPITAMDNTDVTNLDHVIEMTP
jgi:hypothetical protein